MWAGSQVGPRGDWVGPALAAHALVPACLAGHALAGPSRRQRPLRPPARLLLQVTKLARAGGALALAPLVDAGIVALQQRLGLGSRRAAFVVAVAACLALAGGLFGGVVALHA